MDGRSERTWQETAELIPTMGSHAPSQAPLFPGPLSGPEWAAGSAEPDVRRRSGLGVLSVLAVLVAVALEVAGILTSIAEENTLGIVLALLSIVVSVVAVILGIAALITGRGRIVGAAGVVLGLAANPLLQLVVLRAIGGEAD